MKLISIVKELQKQGVDIKYRVRKDGGILITQVSGMRFYGAEGNRFVRTMTGQELSEAQIKQRQLIKPPKKISAARRKKPPIAEDVKRNIKKLQAMYRKDKKKGKPTIRNYRYVAEKYGEEEARRLLKQSEYYIRGIAYTENIEALIQRLHQIEINVQNAGYDFSIISDLIEKTRSYAESHREQFTETKLEFLIAAIYNFESSWNMSQKDGTNDPELILADFASNYTITLTAST